MDKKKITLSVGIVLLLSVAGYAYFFTKPSKPATTISSPSPQLNHPAPVFSKKALDGSTVSLESLRGKIVIIDFFATWCPPCEAEIPHFIQLAQTYKDNVVIIGISVDDSANDVRPFIHEHGINYPVIMSEGELDKLFGGITSIPTTFVLDKNLQIIDKVIGYRDIEYFDTLIKKINK